MGVELLEFNLGFETVLGFHDYVHKFVSIGVPFFDSAQVAGAAFIIDDKGHYTVAQAFLEHQ